MVQILSVLPGRAKQTLIGIVKGACGARFDPVRGSEQAVAARNSAEYRNHRNQKKNAV